MKRFVRFVIRTIRNGRVKINRKWFYPDEQWMKYDGRLDGMRFAFALYMKPQIEIEYEEFVALHSTERSYRLKDPDGNIDWPGPQCVNGYAVWASWGTKECLAEFKARRDRILENELLEE